MVFGLLSAFIGPNFFPNTDPLSATLNALAVFAVGFAFRPLGGIMLGTLADRIGRRRVMLLSIMLMAGTTLVIAVCPSYEQIGVWAGIILVACRILQGISTGIEAPLSTSHAVELVPEGREGYVAGIMSFYVNIGILLASLVSFLCSLTLGGAVMAEWGWRVPFIIGAAFGFVVVYLRRALPETLQAGRNGQQLLRRRLDRGPQALALRPRHHLRRRRSPGLQLRLERRPAQRRPQRLQGGPDGGLRPHHRPRA